MQEHLHWVYYSKMPLRAVIVLQKINFTRLKKFIWLFLLALLIIPIETVLIPNLQLLIHLA